MAKIKEKIHKPAGKIPVLDESQERMMRLNMLEQEAKQFEQQIMYIEQQIMELRLLSLNLEEIDKAKPKSEILASLGRNIFLKTELVSKELYVDIGSKTVVKKNIVDTRHIIDNDVSQLEKAKENIRKEFERIVGEMTHMMQHMHQG